MSNRMSRLVHNSMYLCRAVSFRAEIRSLFTNLLRGRDCSAVELQQALYRSRAINAELVAALEEIAVYSDSEYGRLHASIRELAKTAISKSKEL